MLEPPLTPTFIAAGANNQMFYAAGDAIGEMPTVGPPFPLVIPLEDADGAPLAPVELAPGPDGNEWFTTGSGELGSITPGRDVTLFATGSSGADTLAISASATQVWFTDLAGEIGEVSFCDSDLCAGTLHGVGGDEQIDIQLRRPEAIGILVQRQAGRRRATVGRVPLGHHPRRFLALRWNRRVNGRRLRAGRYLIGLRVLDRHQHVIDATRPVVLNLGSQSSGTGSGKQQ